MSDKEKGTASKAVGGEPQDPGSSRKIEFRILGEEMIEKKVKTSGKNRSGIPSWPLGGQACQNHPHGLMMIGQS
jgi:hypothetical protein